MRLKISEKDLFIARVAGIFLHEGNILLHRAEHDDFWALPGGGCEFSEDMNSALVREVEEELGGSIQVGNLAFVVENFFDWSGKRSHEIGFYFQAQFVGESKRFNSLSQFEGVEQKMEGIPDFRLLFQWFSLKDAASMDLRPKFLNSKLGTDMTVTAHIVNRGQLILGNEADADKTLSLILRSEIAAYILQYKKMRLIRLSANVHGRFTLDTR